MKNERIQDKLKLLIAKQEIEEEKMTGWNSSMKIGLCSLIMREKTITLSVKKF